MNFKLLFVALLPLFAACTPHYTPADDCFVELLPNASIGDLRLRALSGESFMRDSCLFAGRVTANDEGGNFYQTIVIEDFSGAMTVNLGFWQTASLYPVGLEVVVSARGLSFAIIDGVVNVGLRIEPWSSYRVEPFGSRVVADRYLFRTAPVEALTPIEITAAELHSDLCGRLVRIGGLVCTSDATTWGAADYGSTAEIIFVDDELQVAVETSTYADFATRVIPRGELSLTGILYEGSTSGEAPYTLKLRSADDIEIQ